MAATEKELSETSRVLQLDYTPLTPEANDDQAATPVAVAQ
ncbi:Malate:quinone oxidoreductase|nr:Malate:quinone oxidoreductase [Candidatus Pantoea persica]